MGPSAWDCEEQSGMIMTENEIEAGSMYVTGMYNLKGPSTQITGSKAAKSVQIIACVA